MDYSQIKQLGGTTSSEWDHAWYNRFDKINCQSQIFLTLKDRYLMKTISQYFTRSGHPILDLGGGFGRVALSVEGMAYKAFVVDFSFKAGKLYCELKSYGPKRFIVGDGLFLPIQSNSIQHHMSFGLIEHFHNANEGTNPLVDELFRVTKPGGIGIHDIPCRFRFNRMIGLAKPTFGNLLRKTKLLGPKKQGRAAYWMRELTNFQYKDMLKLSGFDVISIEHCQWSSNIIEFIRKHVHTRSDDIILKLWTTRWFQRACHMLDIIPIVNQMAWSIRAVVRKPGAKYL